MEVPTSPEMTVFLVCARDLRRRKILSFIGCVATSGTEAEQLRECMIASRDASITRIKSPSSTERTELAWKLMDASQASCLYQVVVNPRTLPE